MENGLNLENKTDLISQLVNTGIKEIQNDKLMNTAYKFATLKTHINRFYLHNTYFKIELSPIVS